MYLGGYSLFLSAAAVLSLRRYPEARVPAPMAMITAVLRPDMMRVKEFAIVKWSGYYLSKGQRVKVTLKNFYSVI